MARSIELRGNRYGLADRMDLVVGRLEGHPSGFALRHARASDRRRERRRLRRRPQHERSAARRPRRRAHRARTAPTAASKGASCRSSSAARRRSSAASTSTAAGLGFVVPFDRRVLTDVHIPRGESARRRDRARWSPSKSRAGRRRRAGRSAASSKCSATSTSPASTPRSSCASTRIPDEHSDEAIDEARRIGVGGQGHATSAAAPTSAIASSSPSTASTRATSTMRFRSSGCRTATSGSACTSPTSRTTSPRAARSTPRPTSAARRCIFPSAPCTCFRRSSRPACAACNPHVDRLVQSCLMEVNKRGEVVRYEMHDGVIRSTERMTYTAVNAILTDRDAETMARYRELVPTFELMRELFEILNARRRRRGSVDFDLPRAEDHPRRRRARRRTSSRPSATSRIGSSKSSCCSPTRRWPHHLETQRHAGALPHSRSRPIRSR